MFPNAAMFVINLAVLQLCWNFIDIFQLGTLAIVDPSGRAAALVPAAQGAALAAGPAAAGFVLGLGKGYTAVLLLAGSTTRWPPRRMPSCTVATERIGACPPQFPSSTRVCTAGTWNDRYIDEMLSVADGHLWIEGCDTVDIAAQYGTPLYVVSETQLRANCRRLRASFERYWGVGPVELLPSLKANYTIAVRQILNEEGLGCDVFGHGELQAAMWSGVPGGKISVNGSAKSAPLIDLAVSVGARITLDSERELDLVIAAAERQRKSADVRLRVRPDYVDLTAHPIFFRP
jgi:hypothetical protein